MPTRPSSNFECNNLDPGTEYEIQVVAWLDNGEDSSSAKIKVKTKGAYFFRVFSLVHLDTRRCSANVALLE